MPLRRLLIAAALVALVFAVAMLGGWPDPVKAFGLLTGAEVTSASASAFVVLVCWMLVAVLVVMAILGARTPPHRLRIATHGRSLAVLALGVTILGLGITRHLDAYSVCCANAATTEQAQQRVH